jgi:acyl-CoA synthetase (AMP-forming)/AMP-acid ligase II
MRSEDIEYTYREILNKINIQSFVFESTFKTRVKCAILCKNNLNSAISVLLCIKTACVAIPLSLQYGIDHCKSVIEISDPDVIIIDDFSLAGYFNLPAYDLTKMSFSHKGAINDIEKTLDDVQLLMFTSGSTGCPKGAMITGENLFSNVRDICEYFPISENDRILIARPIYHCAVMTGEFLTALFKGANIVFFNGGYNPIGILNCLQTERISAICATPTFFRHLSQFVRPGRSISAKTVAVSGECLSGETASIIRSVFNEAKIFNVYGLTEASPRISYLPSDLFELFPESVGVPLPSVQFKIANSGHDNSLLRDFVGEIAVRGPNIMKGYYRNEDLTRSVLRDGWLYTGDLGYIDEHGLLYVKGRKDDLIIKAGFNIYPIEIEKALKKIDLIKDVIAYAHKTTNGIGIGVDISLDSPSVTQKDIMKICSDILPKHLLPDKINIVEAVKRNASGKLVRPRRKN